MPSPNPQDPHTTQMMESLFSALRDYAKSSKQQDHEILRKRATEYAATPPVATVPTDEQHAMLTFSVGVETYALDVQWIRGVRALPSITRVPNAPEVYLGVANVRGVLLSILDMCALLGVPSAAKPPQELVQVQWSNLHLGLAVHHIYGVQHIPQAAISPLEGGQFAHGAWITRSGTRVVLLDTDLLLRQAQLIDPKDTPSS